MQKNSIERAGIVSTAQLIAPYIRRTPVVEIDGADFGLDAGVRCSSSWSCSSTPGRSNRAAPSPTCCCAMCRPPAWSPRRAATTVWRWRSPPSARHPRDHLRADRVVLGQDRAHSRARRTPGRHRRSLRRRAGRQRGVRHRSGALPIHAYDQAETLLGQGTLARELARASAGSGYAAGRGRRRRTDRRHRGWYGGRIKLDRRRAGSWRPRWPARCAPGEPVDAAAGGIAADSLAPRRVGEPDVPAGPAPV